jgi:hypothetical protein
MGWLETDGVVISRWFLAVSAVWLAVGGPLLLVMICWMAKFTGLFRP